MPLHFFYVLGHLITHCMLFLHPTYMFFFVTANGVIWKKVVEHLCPHACFSLI